MATTQTSPRESAPQSSQPDRDAHRLRRTPARPNRAPTDDEILGLDSSPRVDVAQVFRPEGSPADSKSLTSEEVSYMDDAPAQQSTAAQTPPDGSAPEPEDLRAAFDANPELRQAWQDAHSYRESFATPEEARAATALLADLDRLDALFFSRRPEDHAELARAVAALDPDAFASLARAMSGLATEAQRHRDAKTRNSAATGSVGAQQTGPPSRRLVEPGESVVPSKDSWRGAAHSSTSSADSAVLRPETDAESADGSVTPNGDNPAEDDRRARHVVPLQNRTPDATPAQIDFFHSANAAAVRNVLDAIESQVERLLPDGVSKSARNRVVGEIYRELDSTLQSNRQLAQQMRDAFRSGSLDTNHQRALVSLITSRARQALPGVAKRVLSEWTSTVVAANHDRRARQRAAESRVDIAGSGRAGSDGIRPMSPRDIDYSRLSDGDILNL